MYVSGYQGLTVMVRVSGLESIPVSVSISGLVSSDTQTKKELRCRTFVWFTGRSVSPDTGIPMNWFCNLLRLYLFIYKKGRYFSFDLSGSSFKIII